MKGITNATNNPPTTNLIYGFEVDTNVSSSPINVSYIKDAEGMSYADRVAVYTSICAPCVVSRTTGDVDYYLDPSDGNRKINGATAYLDGTDGDVCVRVAKIWYKSYFNGSKERFEFCLQDPASLGESGFDCHCHYYGDKTLPYIFVGMFKTTGGIGGCVSVNIAAKPARALTMTQFETGYKATGANTSAQYLGVGMPERSLIAKLLIFLSGSTNSQGFFGNGYYNISPAGDSTVAAANQGFNATSMLASGDTSGTQSGVMSGYFCNLWGNIWEFLHQCCFNNYKVKFTIEYDDLISDITTASYSSLPSTWYESNETMASASTGWNYIRSTMAGDAPCCAFPLTFGGSTSTYYYDGIYVYPSSLTNRCVVVGGSLGADASVGTFCFAIIYPLSQAEWGIGSRLLIRPIQLAQ